jgi:two-component system capsular synthesis sensor histidine kinase RcsC
MTHAPDAPPTVLIVQHDALVAMLLEDALSEAGYRTIWSPDGGSAVAAPGGAAAAPRAAVVDLRLGGGADGREVLRRLRARHPAMPVVAVTGFQPQAPEADLRGLGGPIARVGKPFDWEELLDRLAGVLGGPAAALAGPAQAGPRRRRTDAAPARAV